MKLKKIVTFVTVLGMLSCTVPSISYADSINIKYGNQKLNYSGTQVKYTINGSAIKSKYPGIIVDGISLASAKEVFSDSKIGLTYKFNKKSNTLELKRDDKILILKINSNEAKVNGKKESAPISPRLVQFSDKTTKVYVPARYIARVFGLTYTWDETAGIAAMTGKTVNKKNTKKFIDSKNSKNKANKSTKLIKKENFIYNGKSYNIKGKKVIFSIDKTKLNTSKLPGVYLDKTLMAPAKSLFLSDSVEGSYTLDKSGKILTLGFGNNTLTMILGSKNADYNGTKVKLDKAPNKIKLYFSNKDEIYIPIENVCKLFKIDIKTNGKISTLKLPQDEDIEDIEDTENNQQNDDENEANIDDSTSDENTQAEKTDETFTSDKLPFSWKSINNDLKVDNLTSDKTLTGQSNSTASKSAIVDITSTAADMTATFDTYVVTSDLGFYGVKGHFDDNKLTISLDNMISNSGQSYNTNMRTVNEINTLYNIDANLLDINFELADGVIGYDISLSDDNKALTVKIYKNTITKISGSYKKGAYTFKLTALVPFEVEEEESSDDNINFIIPDVADSIGSASYTSSKDKKLTLFSYFKNSEGGITVAINNSSKLKYYTKQSENSVSITLLESSSKIKKAKDDVKGAVITLPNGIAASQIEDEDNYFSNNFTVTLQGDLREHFKKKPIKYNTDKVTNVSTKLNNAGNTVLTFYTNKLYAYRLKFSKSQINIEIDKAKKLYSKVVVIDPGHGGQDDGTTSINKIYKEKNIVLSIGYTYFRNYLNDENLKVYWTRKDDTYPTLPERAAFAKKVDADIFISVHMNSFMTTTPKGTEVFYSTRNNILQPNGLSSYIMASMFLKNITSTFNTYNRGVKTAAYVVTNINTVPAVLLEYGFLSNKDDLAKFSKLENQDKAAEVLYNTIQEIFAAYPTGR